MSSKKNSNLKYVRVHHTKGRSKGAPKKSPKTSTSKNKVIFKDGVFCLSHYEKNETKEYCLFLINNTFIPPIEEATKFIDKLCYKLKDPCHWLNCFEKLIVLNSTKSLFKDYKKRRIALRGLIIERKNLWSKLINRNGPVVVFDPFLVNEKRIKFHIEKVNNEMSKMKTNKKKIQFLKKRQMEYLAEVENFSNARFVRWVDMEIDILLEPKVYPDKHQKLKLKSLDLLLIDMAITCSAYGSAEHEKGTLDFNEYSEFHIGISSALFCMNDGSLISKRIFRKYINIYRKKELDDRRLN